MYPPPGPWSMPFSYTCTSEQPEKQHKALAGFEYPSGQPWGKCTASRKRFFQCPHPQQQQSWHVFILCLQCHLKRSREEWNVNPRENTLGQGEKVEKLMEPSQPALLRFSWGLYPLKCFHVHSTNRSWGASKCLTGLAVTVCVIPFRRHLFPTWELLKTSSCSWVS